MGRPEGSSEVEARFARLRKKLDDGGYLESFGADSLRLVEHVFSDLEKTTESLEKTLIEYSQYKKLADELECGVAPFKEENVNLLRENSQLRIALAKAFEEAEDKVREPSLRLKDLEAENNDLKVLVSQFAQKVKKVEAESSEKTRRILHLQEKELISGPSVVTRDCGGKSAGLGLRQMPTMEVTGLVADPCPNCVRLRNYVEYGKNSDRNPKTMDYMKMADSRIEALQLQLRSLKSIEKEHLELIASLKNRVNTRDSEIEKLRDLIKIRPGRDNKANSAFSSYLNEKDDYSSELKSAELQLRVLQRRNMDLEEKLKKSILQEHEDFMLGKTALLSDGNVARICLERELDKYPSHDQMTLLEKMYYLERQLSHCCKEKAILKKRIDECECRLKKPFEYVKHPTVVRSTVKSKTDTASAEGVSRIANRRNMKRVKVTDSARKPGKSTSGFLAMSRIRTGSISSEWKIGDGDDSCISDAEASDIEFILEKEDDASRDFVYENQSEQEFSDSDGNNSMPATENMSARTRVSKDSHQAPVRLTGKTVPTSVKKNVATLGTAKRENPLGIKPRQAQQNPGILKRKPATATVKFSNNESVAKTSGSTAKESNANDENGSISQSDSPNPEDLYSSNGNYKDNGNDDESLEETKDIVEKVKSKEGETIPGKISARKSVEDSRKQTVKPRFGAARFNKPTPANKSTTSSIRKGLSQQTSVSSTRPLTSKTNSSVASRLSDLSRSSTAASSAGLSTNKNISKGERKSVNTISKPKEHPGADLKWDRSEERSADSDKYDSEESCAPERNYPDEYIGEDDDINDTDNHIQSKPFQGANMQNNSRHSTGKLGNIQTSKLASGSEPASTKVPGRDGKKNAISQPASQRGYSQKFLKENSRLGAFPRGDEDTLDESATGYYDEDEDIEEVYNASDCGDMQESNYSVQSDQRRLPNRDSHEERDTMASSHVDHVRYGDSDVVKEFGHQQKQTVADGKRSLFGNGQNKMKPNESERSQDTGNMLSSSSTSGRIHVEGKKITKDRTQLVRKAAEKLRGISAMKEPSLLSISEFENEGGDLARGNERGTKKSTKMGGGDTGNVPFNPGRGSSDKPSVEQGLSNNRDSGDTAWRAEQKNQSTEERGNGFPRNRQTRPEQAIDDAEDHNSHSEAYPRRMAGGVNDYPQALSDREFSRGMDDHSGSFGDNSATSFARRTVDERSNDSKLQQYDGYREGYQRGGSTDGYRGEGSRGGHQQERSRGGYQQEGSRGGHQQEGSRGGHQQEGSRGGHQQEGSRGGHQQEGYGGIHEQDMYKDQQVGSKGGREQEGSGWGYEQERGRGGFPQKESRDGYQQKETKPGQQRNVRRDEFQRGGQGDSYQREEAKGGDRRDGLQDDHRRDQFRRNNMTGQSDNRRDPPIFKNSIGVNTESRQAPWTEDDSLQKMALLEKINSLQRKLEEVQTDSSRHQFKSFELQGELERTKHMLQIEKQEREIATNELKRVREINNESNARMINSSLGSDSSFRRGATPMELEREIINLRTALANLDRDKDEMRVELDRKDERIARLTNESSRYVDELSQMKMRLKNAELQINHTGESAREQTREAEFLKKQLEANRKDLEKTIRERDEALKELHKISGQHAKGQMDRRNVESELELKSKEADDLRKQVQRYIDEVRRIEELLLDKEEEMETIIQHYRSLTVENNNLEAQRRSLENEASSIRESVRESVEQNISFKTQLASQNALVQSLEDEIQALTQQVSQLENQVTMKSEKERLLEADVKASKDLIYRLEVQMDKLKLDMADSDSKRKQLEAENMELQAHIGALEARLVDESGRHEQLETLVANSREKDYQMERTTLGISRERDELAEKLTTLQQRSENLNSEVSRYRLKSIELQNELDRTRRQLDVAKRDKETATAEITTLRHQLSSNSANKLIASALGSSGASGTLRSANLTGASDYTSSPTSFRQNLGANFQRSTSREPSPLTTTVPASSDVAELEPPVATSTSRLDPSRQSPSTSRAMDLAETGDAENIDEYHDWDSPTK